MPELYRHTQTGWAIIILADIAAAVALYFAITTGDPGAIAGFLILMTITVLFSSLTIIGTHELLEIRFGIGLIRKRFRLSDILTAQAYRTSFWQGWGIRYCADGLLFNVSGYDAVRITMTNGKQYLIGTDEPRKLLNFLERSRRP